MSRFHGSRVSLDRMTRSVSGNGAVSNKRVANCDGLFFSSLGSVWYFGARTNSLRGDGCDMIFIAVTVILIVVVVHGKVWW